MHTPILDTSDPLGYINRLPVQLTQNKIICFGHPAKLASIVILGGILPAMVLYSYILYNIFSSILYNRRYINAFVCF